MLKSHRSDRYEVVFRSPLALQVCERRLEAHTVNRFMGTLFEMVGDHEDFSGKVRARKVRVHRPVIGNGPVCSFVGTLEPGGEGGTTLRGTFHFAGFRVQAAGALHSGGDVGYIVDTLHALCGFTEDLPERRVSP